MNVMDHTPLRDLLEDAEARGSVDADEMEAAVAGLDLTEEDEADLRRQLDELDVEVVAVRAAEPDIVEAQPRWYHTAATTNSLDLYLAEIGRTPLLDGRGYSAIVTVVVITTLVTPPALKWTMGRAPGWGRRRHLK